jgi:anaerobic selenocysteine-containing dehydrogenase
MRAALAKLDVLAVLDPFEGEITRLATHALPCTWVTERVSFIHEPLYSIDRSYLSPAVVAAGGARRHSWWIFAQLGRRLGIDLLDGLDPDTVDDDTVVRHLARLKCDYAEAVFEAGADGVAVPKRHGWVHEKVLPNGRWRLAPRVLVDRLAKVWGEHDGELRLVCGRIMNSVNGRPYSAGDNGLPPIAVSADAASNHGITSGNRVRISTAFGAIEGAAEVDATLADGSVWINHGWLDQNVNQLTDPMPDLLTLQPNFTGIQVQLERVDA